MHLNHTKRNEICQREEGYETDIDTAEHISDRLYRTSLLVRKPRYNRNNSQSDLSNLYLFNIS